MEKERNLNYWTIRKFSLLYSYYAIIDTTDYLADQLFVKNEVRVWFGQEYICPDGPYCVIFCKCRKRDTGGHCTESSYGLSNKSSQRKSMRGCPL